MINRFLTIETQGAVTVVTVQPGGGGGGGGGTSAWGGITGTLSDQTDLQAALDSKVDENAPIAGATKTKITYGTNGLVTGGADATTADIADSSNKRYVTDANLVVIGNTSGTNTGDQDLSGKANVSHTHAPSDITQGGATNGQALVWNGSAWAPATVSATAGGSTTELQYNNAGAFAGIPGTTFSSNTLRIVSQAAGAIPFVIQAATSQTGNLTEWRDSVGAMQSRVRSDCNLEVSSTLYFDDANGWIQRTAGGNTMNFSASSSTIHMSLTASALTPGANATNFSITPLTASTSGIQGTATFKPSARGGNAGVGHNAIYGAGNGSTATTGAAGGSVTVEGGNAGGSGNNNGGGCIIKLGTPTGSGNYGRLNILNLPTASAGLATGDIWSNGGVLTVV